MPTNVAAGERNIMVTFSGNGVRALMLVLLGTLILALDVQTAYAQSSQCANLQGALRQFDSNADFQRSDSSGRQARQLAAQVQDAESQYIRGGCNDDAKAGRQLTRQCQQIGRDVLRLREQYASVSQSVDTANAVAGQREAILQEMARFGCSTGSNAGFSRDRQSVFDRVFGSTTEGDFTDGQMIDGGDYWNYQGYNTVRTVCVRLSDGYFWPVSYSTLQDYIASDAQTCQQSCPNSSVDLYFYNNPGEEPEQMRNMYGQPYTALPTAFAYRTKFDENASCTVKPAADGTISRTTADAGKGRAIVELDGVRFPLPMRDPRGVAPVQAAVEVAPISAVAMADIPLPRPRPGSATDPKENQQDPQNDKLRVVKLGDRTVRVVGPNTPYAQAGQAGS